MLIVNYLKSLVLSFPEQIMGKAVILAGEQLINIQVKKDVIQLEEEQAVAFHYTTRQLLFMEIRACQDV